MDYTWDTSDDEGGMAIDLDAKQDDHAYRQEGVAADEQFAEAKNYDPSEPTDDYDPAEPTHDDADGPGSHNAHRGASEPKEMAHEYDPAEPTLSDEDGDGDGENEENQSQFDSQNEADLAASEPETKGVDDSLSPMKPPAADLCEELNEEKSLDTGDAVNQKDSPMRIQKSVSQSPSLGQGDTDENTQNSLVDEVNSDVPEVTFDDSDFVLEKEPFVAESDAGANTWSHDENKEEEGGLEADNAEEEDSQEMHPSEQERYRRQEEVDSRNEEALVDLFREESDPERMEDEVEQPVKKVKKKAGSKKIKKKGKKIKKGLSKKGQKKVDEDVEDQRFVELRRDRASVESIEEGEVDGEGLSLVRRKSFDERMSLEVYEQAFDIGGGRVEEPREPGEIVEESRKRSTKKKEKREKKRKKNKREVATIEEGNQGDEDSQKFPSFLAGFFVQDEGEEDVDENLVLSRSFENEGEAFQKTGVKNYRKRHSSGAEDSVKSYEPLDLVREESQDSDHRSKNRKHEERRHEGKEARQREARDSREVRHEHRHGTPRAREREREREKARSERERERAREKERENREREREREIAARERTRRVEIEERRRRHTRSGSRERRRRSPSTDRQRRSRSRERVARHRRQRSKSRERSVDRERERVKRRHREKSNDRESERRTRRQTHSRSKTPQRRSERASSNKENRDDSYRRRRRHARTTEESDVEERENVRRSQRRQRRERARSSSSSSSSDSSTDSNVIVRRGHRRNFQRSQSSDEGASSDVILVEPERIVINLDEEEDPPSRVDITHHNIDDDSTKLVDGESIPPPPELSRNARGSALIQINPEEPENDEFEGDATPTRDEHTDSLIQDRRKAVHESDYDPAHPTEEPEEHENVSSLRTLAEPVPAPILITTSLVSQGPVPLFPNESGPVPPDHPPPEEVRPSPPPVPSLSESSIPPPVQPLMFNNAIRPQMALLSTPYHHQQQQQQPSPQLQQPSPQLQQPSPQHQQPSPQHQPGLLPFPGAPPGQGQRFPPWPLVNGPNPNIMHQNTGPPGFVPGQRGLLPTPDTRPLFQLENRPLSFAAPLMSQPPPPREAIPLLSAPIRPPMSTMAPLAQLTSLLPGLDRSKISQIRDDQQVSSHQQAPPPQQLHPQMFKHPLPMSNNLVSKGPLMSNSASNNMSPAIRVSRSGRGGGGDLAESIEVVDMDMSPGEDDCELELPSPNSSDSERDDRRRRGRKSNRTSNDISKTVSIGDKGVIQPAVYLKALSKVIEKLAPKGHPTEPGPTAPPDKSKSHSKKQHRLDVNDDDVPASAVDLTNKEKFLKKLHLQERVIDEVKLAIKPYYSSKKITKEQYKLILRKAVPKVCHSKSGNINPQKIQQLVEAYVNKISKGSHPSSKKRKGHAPKEATGPKDGPGTAAAAPPALRQNGERVKKVTR